VTHPFHPWHGREFVFIVARQNWGEDRVLFFDEDGVRRSLPRAWTDAADIDPFVALAAGPKSVPCRGSGGAGRADRSQRFTQLVKQIMPKC
jgi:hypothetical protein